MSKRKPKKLTVEAWAIRATRGDDKPAFIRDCFFNGPEVFRTRTEAREHVLDAGLSPKCVVVRVSVTEL